MTIKRNTHRRTFVLTGFAATTLAVVLRPARALAEAIRPMVEHPYARANYIPDAPKRAKVGSGKVIRG